MTDINDIQIEPGVPYTKAEAKKTPSKKEPHPLEPKLRAMAPGDSFFLANREAKDMQALLRVGDRIGVYLMAKTMKDEAGVRTWRRDLSQLPKGRREKIEQKVASGEFNPEDMAYKADQPVSSAPTQVEQNEDDGSRFWLLPEEDRYIRTEPGEDITWYLDNCEAITEDAFYNRERYWVYSSGAKPQKTSNATTGRGMESSRIAEEVTFAEYQEALAAFDQDSGKPPALRYFMRNDTNEPVRIPHAGAGYYTERPELYVEINAVEFEKASAAFDAANEDEDLDDL